MSMLKTLDALKSDVCQTFDSSESLFSGSMENYMGTRATFEGIFTAVV